MTVMTVSRRYGRTMTYNPTIVIHARERKPLDFGELPITRERLYTGDYSVAGLTHLIAVERKSLSDLATCIGRERQRFKRELQRLRAHRFRLLVIEGAASDLESPDAWGSDRRSLRGLTPARLVGSLAAWVAQYDLPVWLAGSRQAASRFVERYLFHAARCVEIENATAGAFLKQDREAG